MTWFAVETRYTTDRDRLQEVRPRHREYLLGLVEQGKVLAGGPFADGASGFAVYRVADEEELAKLLAEDPYTTEEISEGRVIREWNITLGPWAQ